MRMVREEAAACGAWDTETPRLAERIAKSWPVVRTDLWHGGRRTVFKFKGHEAWVVEPPPVVEPAAGMPENGEEHILGVQANLWSEFLKTSEDFEYQLLPRMSAASEIQWCAADNKDYDRFRKSLDHMVRIYDKLGFVYCKALWGKIGLPGHEIPARSQEELDTLDFNKVPFMEE